LPANSRGLREKAVDEGVLDPRASTEWTDNLPTAFLSLRAAGFL
jgi:hypothetical protein